MTETSEFVNLKDNSVLVTLTASTPQHVPGKGSGTSFYQETAISESGGLIVGVHLHTELDRHPHLWSQGPTTSMPTTPPRRLLGFEAGCPHRRRPGKGSPFLTPHPHLVVTVPLLTRLQTFSQTKPMAQPKRF